MFCLKWLSTPNLCKIHGILGKSIYFVEFDVAIVVAIVPISVTSKAIA